MMRFRDLATATDWRFLLFDTTGRLPTSMLPLGTMLYVADATGSFGQGGLAVAALSVGGGLGGPLVGMASDRFGQRPVALAATAIQVSALAGFLLAGRSWSLPLIFLVGLANPQIGAMARSRWSAFARRREDRGAVTSTAMAFEGAVDEASFVVGPVLVSTLAGLIDPVAGLLVALILAAVTQTGFALHRSALPGRTGAQVARTGSLPVAHLGFLLLAMAGVGLMFGASSTGVAARMSELDREALTGVVYAMMGIGSATAGLLTVRLRPSFRLVDRIGVAGAAMILAGICLALAPGPLSTGLACLFAGVALAPALISAYGAADHATPAGWGNTTMTGLATANVVGVAVGAAVAGRLIDASSVRNAMLVTAVAGVVVLLAGLAARVSQPGAESGGANLTEAG